MTRDCRSSSRLFATLIVIAQLSLVTTAQSNVHWAGPGGDTWNTNSSPHSPDPTNPFNIAWMTYSVDGEYLRASGLALADVGQPPVPYLFGSTGWGENRPFRRRADTGAATGWVALNGQNDSGTDFRVAISSDASRVYHIDEYPFVRAYSAEVNPAGSPLWEYEADGIFGPGLARALKVGPDDRVYGHNNGGTALDPLSPDWLWRTSGDPEDVVYPGAFRDTGAGYHYIVSGRTNKVSAYGIVSSPASPVWTFTDIENGYGPPIVDPATGAIYSFRSTRLLKLTSAGTLSWRSAAIGVGESVRSYGALSRDGSTIYFHTGTGTNSGRLYAFRSSDGSIKWSYPTGGYAREGIGGPVVTANNLVFVGNAAQAPGDNRLFCIEDSAGVPVLRGTFDLRDEGDVGAPWITIGPGGYVYFDSWIAPNDQVLVAFGSSLPVDPAPTPTGLLITPFETTARLSWDDSLGGEVVGYVAYRRHDSGSYPALPTKYVGPRAGFTDHGLVAGETYHYRVATCNAAGTPTSPFAEASVTLMPPGSPVSRHASRELLVAFYTGGFTPEEVDAMTLGLQRGMEFYWRTTCGRFHMDVTWLFIDAPLPGPDWYTSSLIDDLRSRGIRNDQYDLAYLIGDGLPGCLGGYLVFGSTCAALGTVCGSQYPEINPDANFAVTWTFTHEIHHALELMSNLAGGPVPPVLTCHFPWAYPSHLGATGRHIDMSTDFDGIAGLNRDYGDDWDLFPPPYEAWIEFLDADADGLPDGDDRAWMDEARFGSSSSAADTDGDGLDDLAEFCRYNFRGCNPLDTDSDDDGQLDGLDPEPLHAVSAVMAPFLSAPAIDGLVGDEWPLLANGYYFTKNAAPYELETRAGWRADGLYFAFRSSRMLRYKISIDGSGQDGRWESPVRHTEGATNTLETDQKHTHIGDSWADGRHIALAYGDSEARVHGVGTIPGAQVASAHVGGVYQTEVFIPQTLPGGAAYTWYPPGNGTPVTTGLTLLPGQVIGLAITATNLEDSNDDEFSGTWTSVFETLSLVDVQLLSTSDAGETATLAPSPGLYLTNPFRPGDALRLVTGSAGSDRTSSTVGPVIVDVFDVTGRRVCRLLDGAASDGPVDMKWDGRSDSGREAATGVYFLRATTPEQGWRRKLVLVR